MDGQKFNLSQFIANTDDFRSTAQPEEKGTVLSGENNQTYGENAVIAGGTRNSANAIHTTVAGGNMNAATTSHATVAGGRENSAIDFYATVGGGYANTASARDTFVGGGSRNTAGGPRSVVGGGIQNQATGPDTVIAGGAYNQTTDNFGFVGGGTRNLATGYASVIAGGAGNIASTDQATISGGLGNQVVSIYGTIGGGYGNVVLGNYATVPGGSENRASGDYSLAAGQRAVVSAEHSGTFVYADSSDKEFPSETSNEFAVRASGGVRFVSAVNLAGEAISGVQLPPGSGSWSTLSDRSAKINFTSVNQQEILELVADLPISLWTYKGQDESVRHIGPVSQDFYETFSVGENERFISAVDADGVALAAIQGMYLIIQEQEYQIKNQEDRLLELESRLGIIEIKIDGQNIAQPKILHWLGWGLFLYSASVSIWKTGLSYISGLSRRKP